MAQDKDNLYGDTKMETSKSYKVTPGKTGQVKQVATDWSGVEQIGLWNAVINEGSKANEAIQAQAVLRGQLDHTGNLVAENSWFTQESYDQGRASVEAANKKNSFLTQAQTMAQTVAFEGGTMEDYNQRIEPIYQEYIKAIKNLRLYDVNGELQNVELQGEFIKKNREEMITYAALGQEQFQKIKEQQVQIDAERSNNLNANAFVYGVSVAADAQHIPMMMLNYYQQTLATNIALDPIKGSAQAQALFQESLGLLMDNLKPNSPTDVAKVEAITRALNDPAFGEVSASVKAKIHTQGRAFEEASNYIYYNELFVAFEDFERQLTAGTFNIQDALAKEVEAAQLMRSGKITPGQYQTLANKVTALGAKMASAEKERPESVLEFSPQQVAAAYKGPNAINSHAEAVYQIFAQTDEADFHEQYLEWANDTAHKLTPEYANYAHAMVSKSVSSLLTFHEGEELVLQDITDVGGATTSQRWGQVAKATKDPNTGAYVISAMSASMPESYRQAFSYLASTGKISGDALKDVNDIRRLAADLKRGGGDIATLTSDDLAGSFLGFFNGKTNKSWYAPTETIRQAQAQEINRLLKDETVRARLISAGYVNLSTPDYAMSALKEMGYIQQLSNRYIVTDPTFTNAIYNEAHGSVEQMNAVVKARIEKIAKTSNQSEEDITVRFENDKYVFYGYDDNGKAINFQFQTKADRELINYAKADVVKDMTAVIDKASGFNERAQTFTGSKGTSFRIDMGSMKRVTGNDSVSRESLQNIATNEGTVFAPIIPQAGRKFRNKQGQEVSLQVIGSGITNMSHQELFDKMVVAGKSADKTLFYKLNQQALEKHFKDSNPSVQRALNNKPPEKYTPEDVAVAAAIHDAGWLGGPGGPKNPNAGAYAFATAVTIAKTKGADAALKYLETTTFENDKSGKSQIRKNYQKGGEYNTRGIAWRRLFLNLEQKTSIPY